MKAICTTTIHAPTKAIKKFVKIAHDQDWLFFIVGDLKTPHEEYKKFEDDRIIYISPEYQEKHYPKLSEAIGWNCIQRRNFGFIEAYKAGAEIIATIDDDNIPLENWGKKVYVNKISYIKQYFITADVFDPLSVTGLEHFWHRGYPLELLEQKNNWTDLDIKKHITPLIQADLWKGEPDIDALCRINFQLGQYFMDYDNELGVYEPYMGDKISPFNSQNTFLSRQVFPYYFLFPHIGRFDDIWASYVTQFYFPERVIYGPASVNQDRNDHNLINDLENEIYGYKYNLEFIKSPKSWEKYLPEKSLEAYELYKKEFR